jgi:hypothetical protein
VLPCWPLSVRANRRLSAHYSGAEAMFWTRSRPGLRCRGPALRAVTTGRTTAEGSLLPRKTSLEALELIASERQRKGCSLEVSQRPALQVSLALTLRDEHHTTPALAHLAAVTDERLRPALVAAQALDGVAAERFLIATHPARQRYFDERAGAWPRRFDARAQTGADEFYDAIEIGAHLAATMAAEGRD